jgi:hypothetical protein
MWAQQLAHFNMELDTQSILQNHHSYRKDYISRVRTLDAAVSACMWLVLPARCCASIAQKWAVTSASTADSNGQQLVTKGYNVSML